MKRIKSLAWELYHKQSDSQPQYAQRDHEKQD